MPNQDPPGQGSVPPEIDYSQIDYNRIDYSKLDPTKIDLSGVNFADNEHLRNWASRYEKASNARMQQLSRQYEDRIAQQEQQFQAQLNALQQFASSYAPEEAQHQLAATTAQQEVAMWRDRHNGLMQELARDQEIRRIAQEYGDYVSYDDLANIQNPWEAHEIVTQRAVSGSQKQVKTLEEKVAQLEARLNSGEAAAASTTDMGGGTPVAPQAQAQTHFDSLMRGGQINEAIAFANEQARGGVMVDPNLWRVPTQ